LDGVDNSGVFNTGLDGVGEELVLTESYILAKEKAFMMVVG